jgi:DnaD/phage-associated family protein
VRYATVQTRIWRLPEFRSLSENARNTYLYLMTNGHTNMAGYYHLPLGYVTEDMQKDVSEVQEAFDELTIAEFIAYDPGAKVVLIKEHFVDSPINGPKQAAGAIAAVMDVPTSPLLAEFVACALRYSPGNAKAWHTLSIPYRYPIDTLPHTPSIPVSVSVSDPVVVDSARPDEMEPAQGAPEADLSQKKGALDYVNSFGPDWYLTGLPWEDLLDYGESLGWLLVIEAVNRTAAAGSKHIKYCLKILKSWQDEGLTSVEKVLAAEAAWAADRKRRERAYSGRGQAPKQSNVLWSSGEKKPPEYYAHIYKKFDDQPGAPANGKGPDPPDDGEGKGSASA